MKVVHAILILLFLLSFQKGDNDIHRFNQHGFFENTIEIIPHIIDFQDTIPNDTLFEYRDVDQLPLMYSRKILTGVCIEGKCRLVKIDLYWHTTGRYLGYVLPEGEFLSKTEHHPFVAKEYDRLHVLLADPQSALSQYSLNELVPPIDTTKKTSKNAVDAVSTATLAAVLDYIVEGAVYTTYTLWHIIHGQTKREIELLTSSNLSTQLILRLLESESLTDQVWALEHISGETTLTAEIMKKLFSYIGGDDVYLTERALNALHPARLSDNTVQFQLAKLFKNANFLQQRLILQKLQDAPQLNSNVIQLFVEDMSDLNGTLVKSMIELLLKLNIQDEIVVAKVQELLDNENRYIANQALKYLESLDNTDNKTQNKIEKYKKKNNL